MMNVNRQWVLVNRPTDAVGSDTLRMIEGPIPEPAEDEILVRNLYLSLDPTNRLWMSDREQYLPPVGIGETMRGSTLGRVVQSRSAKFREGDLVALGTGGWQDYSVVKGARAQPIEHRPGVPLTAHLSVLGLTGITAYFGLLDVGSPVAGETVVVSAAAGAVGSIVGQIARIVGCKVIGIAGGPEKCAWITQALGFDGAIDYKSEDVGTALDRLAPDGIDVDFENVGGPIMNEVFGRLRKFGRMVVCGLISSYNSEQRIPGPVDFGLVLMNRLQLRGFVVIDYLARADEARGALGQWIAEGRIQWKDHVVEGLERAPDALDHLFTGRNDGKLIIRLAT